MCSLALLLLLCLNIFNVAKVESLNEVQNTKVFGENSKLIVFNALIFHLNFYYKLLNSKTV